MNKDLCTRKEWVDGLRGLAMLMVVAGHCFSGWNELFAVTNSVKMPLFFAISGYLFKESTNFTTLVNKLFYRIVIPWITLGGVIVTCLSIFQKEPIYNGWYDLISGEGIWWFLPCFLWGSLINSILRKTCQSDSFYVLCSFMCFFGGLFMSNIGSLNFMMFNRAFVVQLFFCLGYIVRQNQSILAQVGGGVKLGLVAVYVIGCLVSILFYPNNSIDVRANEYFELSFNSIMIVWGVLMMFVVAFSIERYPKMLLYIGKNTFPIYIFHMWFVIITGKIIDKAAICGDCLYLKGIIKFVISIAFSLVVSSLLNRYAPKLIGKNI